MRFVPLLPLLMACPLPAQSPQDTLLDALRARIGTFQGTVSLYAKNLDTGESVGIRPSDPVRTASTIKLPILTAVFDQVAAGKAKWNEPLRSRHRTRSRAAASSAPNFPMECNFRCATWRTL